MEFITILLSLFLGILGGIVTGITPGLHTNLVAVFLFSLSLSLQKSFSPLYLAVFLVSLAVTHTFLDALPSIYLGAPDESQILNVLPGHRLLLQGNAHQAVFFTVLGSYGSLMLSLAFFPLFILLMPKLQVLISPILGYLLLTAIIFLFWREKENRLKIITVFLLSGVLGLIVLDLKNMSQPLLPLLSGLFGISLLILSWFKDNTIPKQHFSPAFNLPRKDLFKTLPTATGMGFVAAFLPGLGSSQSAVIATTFFKKITNEAFLMLVAGINTVNLLVSLGTLYALQKARNGAIAVLQEMLGSITFQQMLFFLGVAMIAGGTAAICTLRLSKLFAKIIPKVNYQKLVLGVLVFVFLLTLLIDGFLGITILVIATALGIVASSWKVPKHYLMGCLLLPVMLWFLL